MVSPIVLALPFFLIARNFDLLDRHITLMLIYLTFNLPIVIWIVTDQIRGIPMIWTRPPGWRARRNSPS